MAPQELPTHTELERSLLQLDRSGFKQAVQQLQQTHSSMEIIDTYISPALEHIGELWESGQVALSQVYMSGRMCEELLQSLMPADGTNIKQTPKIGLVVLHDYHILGKRIVASLLHSSGYTFVDYGHGVESDALVRRVIEDHIDILLISTLMLPSAFKVREVSEQLKQHTPNIQIIVGGAPFRFDDQLWQTVGADAMCRSASEAISVVANLSQTRP